MAKKGKSHRKNQITIPLAVVAGLAVPVIQSYQDYATNADRVKGFILRMTGWDSWNNKFSFKYGLARGWTPIGIGFLTHYLANKVGINRVIARAGIPFIRI